MLQICDYIPMMCIFFDLLYVHAFVLFCQRYIDILCQFIDSLHSSIYGDGLFSLARKCTILFHHSLWYSLSSLHFLLLQVRYGEIISDSAYLDGILAEGAMKAAGIADATLNNVYQAMGFLQR